LRAPKSRISSYLLRLSSLSGGRTTRRPSIGKAFSSMLKPMPSLWGNAAPILVQRLPVLPQERGKLIDGPVYAVESPLHTTRAADDGRTKARE
jgi:hypothetical protein